MVGLGILTTDQRGHEVHGGRRTEFSMTCGCFLHLSRVGQTVFKESFQQEPGLFQVLGRGGTGGQETALWTGEREAPACWV